MKKISQLLILILVIFSLTGNAQILNSDSVYDHHGNKYAMADVNINSKYIDINNNSIFTYSSICISGYFEVYGEAGCGMENPSNPLHIARRQVLCQVLTDVSNFINSGLTSNPNPLTNKVRIALKPLASITNTGVLGAAAPLYALNGVPITGGLTMDNQVWKTINGGVDAWFNNAAPIQTWPGLFHGLLAFNFTTTALVPPTGQNLSLTSAATGTNVDFYTLVLHEVIHELGFASAIGFNGVSLIGAGAFTRYDNFLKKGTNSLILQSTGCGPNFAAYNFAGVPPISNLSPGSPCSPLPATLNPNVTTCSTAVMYVSSTNTVPVYTPPCYVTGSSLSHFADMCYPPGSPPDQYFVMSQALPISTTKRYPKQEERNALCDLGYNLNSSFGNPSNINLNYFSYGSGCYTGVAGVNDGVTADGLTNNAVYNFTTSIGVPYGPVFPLVNDVSAVTFTCLQVVQGVGLLSNTFGTSFTYTPSTPGIHLLNYYPVNALGQRGNLTHVYFFVKGNCPALCNNTSNGGFESGSNCGPYTAILPCWLFNYGTPDVYRRFCPNYGLPQLTFDTPAGPGTGNDALLYFANYEGAQNQLSIPLIPGNTYQLSFKVLKNNSLPFSEQISVKASNVPTSQNPVFSPTNIPGYYNSLAVFNFSTPYTWTPYTTTFVYTGTNNAFYVNFFNSGPASSGFALDDVSINLIGLSGAASFTLPSQMCIGQSIPNLTANITPTNISGTFNGPGIQNIGGVWSLNLNPPVIAGTYTYNYINTNTVTGCTFTTTASMQVLPTINFSLGVGSNTCLILGQSTTLTAVPNQTGNITYTWMPGNINAPSVAVLNPTATIIYTAIVSNGACSSTNTFTVNVLAPPQFTNVPSTLCTFQNIYFLENYLAPGTPTGGTWSGIGGITATLGLTALLLPGGTPPGTYTITYTYGAGICLASNSFTLNVLQGFSLTTNTQNVYCTNLPGGAVISATATPPGGVTFTWNPGNLMPNPSYTVTPAVTTVYTVVASNGACQYTSTVRVIISNSCCPAANYLNSSVIGNTVSTTTLSGSWAINQNLTVQGLVLFQGEFRMAAGVQIDVANGGTLSTQNTAGGGAHFYSCGDMWQGISVQEGGRIELINGDVVEDAIEAVSVNFIVNTNPNSANFNIYLYNTTFNRNYKGVSIKSYNQLTNFPPFLINACIFTSRGLGIPNGSFSWPTAMASNLAGSNLSNNLSTPHTTIITYPVQNLKPPYNNQSSYAGVWVENCGITNNPTALIPSYFSIGVGDNGSAPTYNLFDYVMHGIYSKNSNVVSYNNIFQNNRAIGSFGGAGILAINDNTFPFNSNNYISIVHSTNPSININRFYNCKYGIQVFDIFELNAQYGDFRSTQNANIPNLNLGRYGIYVRGNRFKNYQIKNNKIQNINIGVYVAALPGAISLPVVPFTFGMYFDKINIVNNLFSPTIGTVAPIGTGYIAYGVYCISNIQNSPPNTFYNPSARLTVGTNTFSRVWRGDYISSFSNPIFGAFTANNTMTMVPQASPNQTQHGFEHNSNRASVVNSNTVSGTGTNLTNSLVRAVYASQNYNTSVQCNSVTNTYAGFNFASYNFGSAWANNVLQVHRRGMQLTNTGIIGPQGTTNAPSDNRWLGGWAGANYGLFNDLSSTAYSNTLALTNPSNSVIWVRNIAGGYFPPNIGGIPFIQSYAFPGAIQPGNNNAPIFNCTPIGGGPPPMGGVNNPQAVAMLEGTATDNLAYVQDIAVTSEINKTLLYRTLDNDPVLTATSAVLQNFYNANTTTNKASLYSAEKQLASGNLNLAASILTAISPSTNIENNYRLYYELYKNYLSNGSLTPVQNSNLLTLSYQCPFTDGNVVYDARNLYSIVNLTVINYNDTHCTEVGFAFRSFAPDSGDVSSNVDSELMSALMFNEKQSESKFKNINISNHELFPNPAQNEVNISSIINNETITIRLNDVSGKLLLEKEMEINNHSAKLKLNLLNGIYFVEIINSQNQREFKKLIISK